MPFYAQSCSWISEKLCDRAIIKIQHVIAAVHNISWVSLIRGIGFHVQDFPAVWGYRTLPNMPGIAGGKAFQCFACIAV